MRNRIALTGLCLLCALIASATAAVTASAVNTTVHTCEEVPKGQGNFEDAHCKSLVPPEDGIFEHIPVPKNTKTTAGINNTTTGLIRSPASLTATVAGVSVTLEAKKVAATGTVENVEEGGEEFVRGETSSIALEEVTANHSCSVTGIPGGVGKIETLAVKATSKATAMALKFEPKEGTKVAEFELSGASCLEALKGKYPVVGTVSGVPNGATTAFTHATVTEAKTLRLKSAVGPVAGLEASITWRGTDPSNPKTGEWPLATTT